MVEQRRATESWRKHGQTSCSSDNKRKNGWRGGKYGRKSGGEGTAVRRNETERNGTAIRERRKTDQKAERGRSDRKINKLVINRQRCPAL